VCFAIYRGVEKLAFRQSHKLKVVGSNPTPATILCKYCMRALLDKHPFLHTASVPWPLTDSSQVDWELGVFLIENWLNQYIGARLNTWAWSDSELIYHLGVGFRWEQDKTLFILRWSQ
jgi:hypothetical protein